MPADSSERVSPLVFVVGGAIVLAALGFVVDAAVGTSGSTLVVDGPLSDVTTYNFTLLGAIAGGLLGAFVGLGLV